MRVGGGGGGGPGGCVGHGGGIRNVLVTLGTWSKNASSVFF